MSAPDDLSGLAAALESGGIDARQIVALWCKTEGNGLRNDWTRAYADLVLRTALARRLGTDADSLRERIPILVSGGSEGVVSPHLVVITAAPADTRDHVGLVAGIAGGVIPQEAVGTRQHGQLTAELVRAAMAQARLTAADTRLVFVRAPSDPARAGWDTRARAAGALGAAIALDEVAEAAVTDDAFGVRHDLFCSRAFVVARHDGLLEQVLVLGNAPGGNPAFRIAHGVLADPIDARGVAGILAELDLNATPQLTAEAGERVIAVMSKGDAPLSGAVRGLRHVMSIDNDVAMHRHARAAYGTLLASAIGHTACLVSGGAEHQGPADGGFAAIIARID
jgi:cyanuric acid amidohydrolase